MEAANLRNALASFLGRRPCLPFLIELSSGDRIRIAHPDVIRFEGNIVVVLVSKGRHRIFDSSSVCQVLDVPPSNAPP